MKFHMLMLMNEWVMLMLMQMQVQSVSLTLECYNYCSSDACLGCLLQRSLWRNGSVVYNSVVLVALVVWLSFCCAILVVLPSLGLFFLI